jgi:dTDP-4-dehydrorhamnose 3,5-epimerase
VTDYYSKDHDRGLAFDDPALGIDWLIPRDSLLLSEKDRYHSRLADLPAYF